MKDFYSRIWAIYDLFVTTMIALCMVFFLTASCSADLNHQKLSLNACLLPPDHPLQTQLKSLFEDPHMFDSQDNWRNQHFQVLKRAHRGLMVAGHPSIDNYLFKKFTNRISQRSQLKNYLRRVSGARALKQFIEQNQLKHVVVPQKWIYPLPDRFNSKEKTYLLIVEKMDLCSHDETAKRYFTIDDEILYEICRVVHTFRGLDSILDNLPFTHQNQIAFIDTDKWAIKRKGFLNTLMDYMSEEKRQYALNVWRALHEK